ncbi:MAG: hypothetical protein KIS78_02835 [Labilithrix sp.]|nr:hypothetical protein [Labilithrix sp.]
MTEEPARETSAVSPPPRRRSLTNVGGEIETSGDPAAAALLAHAIDVAPSMDEGADDRAHVHGFHAYPARAHPVTARRLVEALVPPSGTVLDPFCGSGTVIIEAMLAGRAAIGSDLNPVAVMLARAKTYPRTLEKTTALVAAARGVAAHAEARRKAKAGASRRLPQEDVSLFPPHVLLELDGLRAGIAEAAPELRPDLSLVLSSILVKLSPRRGDTSEEQTDKRIAAGYASRLFVRKTEELARRFDDFALLLRKAACSTEPGQDDALDATGIGSPDAAATPDSAVAASGNAVTADSAAIGDSTVDATADAADADFTAAADSTADADSTAATDSTADAASRTAAGSRGVTAARPRVRVWEDDANVLKRVADGSVDAVITSPPYVATYDYLQHHELRMRWLGLDPRKLARGEIGARRRYERLSIREAVASWEHELAKLFHSLARVMKSGAPLVLLIADSAAGRGPGGERAEPIRADEVVARVAARDRELVPIARASQARPHFHGPTQRAFAGRPRFEHALLLRRA